MQLRRGRARRVYTQLGSSVQLTTSPTQWPGFRVRRRASSPGRSFRLTEDLRFEAECAQWLTMLAPTR
jgi:hypothetical protein